MAISIGAVGSVLFDTLNDRWKGVLTTLYRSVEEIHMTLKQVLTYCLKGTRISIRVLVAPEVDLEALRSLSLPWREDTPLIFEAAIPVNRHGLGAVVYFGANTPERKTPSDIRLAEWKLIGKLKNRVRKDRILPGGFSAEILHSEPLIEEILQLREVYRSSYTAYIASFDPATIARMIEENYVAVVRNQRRKIVSVCQAESASFDIEGNEWRLVELSDTATDPEYRSHGFSEICKRLLIRRVRGERTVIFTESRANFAGVQVNNHNIGMRVCGRLEKHCVMDSNTRTLPQEDQYSNIFVFSYKP